MHVDSMIFYVHVKQHVYIFGVHIMCPMSLVFGCAWITEVSHDFDSLAQNLSRCSSQSSNEQTSEKKCSKTGTHSFPR